MLRGFAFREKISGFGMVLGNFGSIFVRTNINVFVILIDHNFNQTMKALLDCKKPKLIWKRSSKNILQINKHIPSL